MMSQLDSQIRNRQKSSGIQISSNKLLPGNRVQHLLNNHITNTKPGLLPFPKPIVFNINNSSAVGFCMPYHKGNWDMTTRSNRFSQNLNQRLTVNNQLPLLTLNIKTSPNGVANNCRNTTSSSGFGSSLDSNSPPAVANALTNTYQSSNNYSAVHPIKMTVQEQSTWSNGQNCSIPNQQRPGIGRPMQYPVNESTWEGQPNQQTWDNQQWKNHHGAGYPMYQDLGSQGTRAMGTNETTWYDGHDWNTQQVSKSRQGPAPPIYHNIQPSVPPETRDHRQGPHLTWENQQSTTSAYPMYQDFKNGFQADVRQEAYSNDNTSNNNWSQQQNSPYNLELQYSNPGPNDGNVYLLDLTVPRDRRLMEQDIQILPANLVNGKSRYDVLPNWRKHGNSGQQPEAHNTWGADQEYSGISRGQNPCNPDSVSQRNQHMPHKSSNVQQCREEIFPITSYTGPPMQQYNNLASQDVQGDTYWNDQKHSNSGEIGQLNSSRITDQAGREQKNWNIQNPVAQNYRTTDNDNWAQLHGLWNQPNNRNQYNEWSPRMESQVKAPQFVNQNVEFRGQHYSQSVDVWNSQQGLHNSSNINRFTQQSSSYTMKASQGLSGGTNAASKNATKVTLGFQGELKNGNVNSHQIGSQCDKVQPKAAPPRLKKPSTNTVPIETVILDVTVTVYLGKIVLQWPHPESKDPITYRVICSDGNGMMIDFNEFSVDSKTATYKIFSFPCKTYNIYLCATILNGRCLVAHWQNHIFTGLPPLKISDLYIKCMNVINTKANQKRDYPTRELFLLHRFEYHEKLKRIRTCQNFQMRPTFKQFLGGNTVKGLYFSTKANIPFSCSNRVQLSYCAGILLNPSFHRFYFADFEDGVSEVRANLVICCKNTPIDDDCSMKLIPLDAFNNPFIQAKYENGTYRFFITTAFHLNVYYTENVDIRMGNMETTKIVR